MDLQAKNIFEAFSGQQSRVTILRPYIDIMGGNLPAAAMLDQLVFWSKHSKKGGWVYKTDNDWVTEIGISARSARTARKNLQEIGLIQTKIKKANGNPTLHYLVDFDKLLELLNLSKTSNGNDTIDESICQNNKNSGNDNNVKSITDPTQTGTTNTTTQDHQKGGGDPAKNLFKDEVEEYLQLLRRWGGPGDNSPPEAPEALAGTAERRINLNQNGQLSLRDREQLEKWRKLEAVAAKQLQLEKDLIEAEQQQKIETEALRVKKEAIWSLFDAETDESQDAILEAIYRDNPFVKKLYAKRGSEPWESAIFPHLVSIFENL